MAEDKDRFVMQSGTVIQPSCYDCKWRNEDIMTCKAFPVRIPLDILTGRNDHKSAYPGDNGIQYEQK